MGLEHQTINISDQDMIQKKNVNLYDLQKDPKEEHNILNAELIKKMEEKLSYFIEIQD